ncbi:E3 ubiquitin-protein ligase rnf14 [Cladophialophora chaetospira]|uniref:E3 ubiquitin-protein ligase rnf14 n=1 Tax=Cladophialophora chaetospira TaxID=386627 RepID=A0AA39CC29_9EURO|nr:E3 ubiquitin-protein ligase rnf14 [Cladophialophora chaetospira]
MGDNEHLGDWKIYWKINVLFHATSLAKAELKCMWCDKEEISTSLMRSDFALSAVKCSAGHVPAVGADSMIGVCVDCDAELIQRVTERRQQCFQKGCRRYALVQKENVIRRLGQTKLAKEEASSKVSNRKEAELLRRYLVLVDQHRFFDCEVCYCEKIAPEQYPDLQTTSRCRHDPVQCRDCLRRDIEGRINAGDWRTIICPDQDCDEELAPRDVDKFVSPEIFKA